MSYLARAVTAVLRADARQVELELAYCNTPARVLQPLADALAVMHPSDREAWLEEQSDRLNGRSPHKVLEAGDVESFIVLCRLLPKEL